MTKVFLRNKAVLACWVVRDQWLERGVKLPKKSSARIVAARFAREYHRAGQEIFREQITPNS